MSKPHKVTMRGERRRRRGRRTNRAGWIAVSAQRVKPSRLAMAPGCIFGGPSPLATTSLHRCPPLPRTNPTTGATILSLCLPPYWLRLGCRRGSRSRPRRRKLVTWSRGCGRGVPPRGQARYHPCSFWPGRRCSPAERSHPTSRAPSSMRRSPDSPAVHTLQLQGTGRQRGQQPRRRVWSRHNRSKTLLCGLEQRDPSQLTLSRCAVQLSAGQGWRARRTTQGACQPSTVRACQNIDG